MTVVMIIDPGYAAFRIFIQCGYCIDPWCVGYLGFEEMVKLDELPISSNKASTKILIDYTAYFFKCFI
jgi:hypothetical protein